MKDGISVIIACYNSEKVIEDTLKYLQAQVFPKNINWEVILIDNNSDDNTGALTQSVWDQSPIAPLKIIKEPKVGLAHARQAGIDQAQYSILSFVDDDNWVSTNWITLTFELFDKIPDMGVLGSETIGAFESTPPDWFWKDTSAFAIGKLYEGDLTDITSDASVFGAGLCIRKEIYQKLRQAGWKPKLTGRVGSKQTSGEDSEICLASRLLGYKIYYTNQKNLLHYTLANRITTDRYARMTEGFGSADVFLLPYHIVYQQLKGNRSLLLKLRENWRFNYWGKKLSLNIKVPLYFLRNVSVTDSKGILKIRLLSFCKTIKQERQEFKNQITELRKIFKTIAH